MALSYQVTGPAKLQVTTSADAQSSPTWADVGFADDSDLFSFGVQQLNRAVGSSDHGDEPGEVIFTGSLLTFTGTLSKWDTDLTATGMINLLTPPGGTAVGHAGKIGERWVTGGHILAFRIFPLATSAEPIYTFPRAYTDGDFATLEDFGNDITKLRVSFVAMRNANAATIADGSLGTSDLFTIGATSGS